MGNVSKIEEDFDKYISTLGYNYERNNRTVLKRINSRDYTFELDFWFPEQNIGIEFDGDYYHSKYNAPPSGQLIFAGYKYDFMKHLMFLRDNPRAVVKFACSYDANIFIYHVYEFEWRDKVLQEKIKYDIKQILENKQSFDTSCNLITIDAGKDNYLVLLNQGYVIEKYNCPEIIKKQGKLKIYNCGTLTMVNYERFEKQIDNVVYKDEIYSVRDNGAVMRLSKNERKRELDNMWTFGTQKTPNDYLKIGGVCVHKIIATGFLSNEQIEGSIIEHIDKNKKNNKPSNLKYKTKKTLK